MSSCDTYSDTLGETPGDEAEEVACIPYPMRMKKTEVKEVESLVQSLTASKIQR